MMSGLRLVSCLAKQGRAGEFGLLLLAFLCTSVVGYKPVILVHGIKSDGPSLYDLRDYIKQASPGTNVTSLDIYNNLESFVPLATQLPVFIEKVRPIMAEAKDGVHLICHSQGKTFISSNILCTY